MLTLAALPLLLAGCGWTPLNANSETGPASEELRAIKVEPIADRIGQRLALALRDALNPGGERTPPRYDLRTTLAIGRADLGVASEGLATRGKLDVFASFTLVDLKDGHILLNSTVHSANAFDIPPNEYAALVAEDDARTRTVAEVRQELLARLTLFMQRRAAGATGPG